MPSRSSFHVRIVQRRSRIDGGEDIIDLRDDPSRPWRTVRRPAGRRDSRRPSQKHYSPDPTRHGQLRETRFFGSPAFRRLWFSQLFSSLGDWMGYFATAAVATKLVGPGGAASAVGLTLASRMVPSVIFSPFAGIIVDRYNRKKLMVACDAGRALVFCLLPFVKTLWQLLLASLVLELLTLVWSPAKEASVPKLVSKSFLPTANSLSVAAAYGPAPFAPALFALFAKAPEWLGQSEFLRRLNLKQESLALYADALTYLISATVIATLAIPHRPRNETYAEGRDRLYEGFREAKDGWSYIVRTPRVRAIVFGLAAALIGGGMVVPLGTIFASEVLHAGNGGYGLLLTSMGTGVAVGVISVGILQKRMQIERWFVISLFGASISLVAASLMHGLTAAILCVGFLGVFAGAAYVCSYSSMQANVNDIVRGRVFVTFYAVTRACIVLALVIAPVLSRGLYEAAKALFGTPPILPGIQLNLYGVRMTFWCAGAVVFLSGLFALKSMHRPEPITQSEESPQDGNHSRS